MSIRIPSRFAAAAVLALTLAGAAAPSLAQPADYVIHLTVDGLRPDAITTLGSSQLPNFYRLRNEGAFTDNARTDYDYSITLPNHTSMLTGRPVLDQAVFGAQSGHQWTSNSDPTMSGGTGSWSGSTTIHQKAGYTVQSAFNVANAAGLSTGLYATKTKFLIYQQSYDPQIDRYVNVADGSSSVLSTFLTHMGSAATRNNYSFISFHDTDSAGHDHNWSLTSGSQYLNAVKAVDGYLGQILSLIDSTPALAGRTSIVLSADHGGTLGTTGHGTASSVQNYTIPFYVWGAGVEAGDLYDMNELTRLDPGTGRPLYSAALQPIRNGDGGNLSMMLLGLDAIAGSNINGDQSLVVPEPGTMSLLAGAGVLLLARRRSA